jgi:hypothetical protein
VFGYLIFCFLWEHWDRVIWGGGGTGLSLFFFLFFFLAWDLFLEGGKRDRSLIFFFFFCLFVGALGSLFFFFGDYLFFYFVGAESLGDWDRFSFGGRGTVFWFTSMGRGGPVYIYIFLIAEIIFFPDLGGDHGPSRSPLLLQKCTHAQFTTKKLHD